jgi:hypothetical protein
MCDEQAHTVKEGIVFWRQCAIRLFRKWRNISLIRKSLLFLETNNVHYYTVLSGSIAVAVLTNKNVELSVIQTYDIITHVSAQIGHHVIR